MREFYLLNEKGQRFDFNRMSKVLISDVSGLGFKKNIEYLQYGDTFKKLKEGQEIEDINLTLVFLEGYKGYAKFLAFVEDSSAFDFYYVSNDVKFVNAEIESLSKTQLSYGALSCSLVLKKLSYWFKVTTKEISITQKNDGKIYPYTYPYTYSDSSKGTVIIENKGYAKASLRILLEGELENPEVYVKQDGKIIQKLKIYYSSKNAIIEIDSFPTRQKIEITENDEITNGYELQDFECENFIFLDRGSFEIEYRPHSSGTPKCTIVMTEGYLGN